MAWRLGVPVVGSWHTNVHEFAARRAARLIGWLPAGVQSAVAHTIERRVLDAALLFYRIPRILLAPNAELVELLERRTGRPTRLMRRGIDADRFSPAWRTADDGVFRLGYVGRLSPEKNLRSLVDVEGALRARGAPPFRLVIIGDGRERAWLATHLQRAEFPGILEGDALSRAYANMDLFLFPSTTDTFGNAVLEALASGTPAIVTPAGGPKTIVEDGVSGIVADAPAGFADGALSLMRDRGRLERMRAAARARALEFSWDRIFEDVYAVYTEALRGRMVGRAARPAVS